MSIAVLLPIQAYYVFLIIARHMGWDIPQEKTEEVRKVYPKNNAWNKVVHIYCSRNNESFNRIPARYQPFMAKFLGKVIGKFVCDSIRKGRGDNAIAAYYHNNPAETCLSDLELRLYATVGKPLYFWHISNLEIYDKPKELSEFKAWRWECETVEKQFKHCRFGYAHKSHCEFCKWIRKPPQSMCYVEAI